MYWATQPVGWRLSSGNSPHLWQVWDEVVNVGILCRLNDLRHWYISSVIAVRDILADAAVKQNRLLLHETQLRAQPLDVQWGDISSVDCLKLRGIESDENRMELDWIKQDMIKETSLRFLSL